MSYDLMVFDPLAAPNDRDEFMAWFSKQMEWIEKHSYDDPKVTSQNLYSWLRDMIMEYPSVDDLTSTDEVDNPKISAYNFGRSIVYIEFAWSEMVDARKTVFDLAKKHKVGFFDVSSDNGQVWLPDAEGNYRCIHGDCSS